MQTTRPVLHLICGKIASGKSTLAAELGASAGTVIISEDVWLGPLFGDQMATGADYLFYSGKLQAAMTPHIVALLTAGVSVVLDFPANTVAQRRWMRQLIEDSGAAHQLHFLDVPDDICLQRLRARNSEDTHEFSATEAQFRQFTAHFVPPMAEEDFDIVHR